MGKFNSPENTRPQETIPLSENDQPQPDFDHSAIRKQHAEMADFSGNIDDIDLHGMNREEAENAILKFVHDQAATDTTCCRIIHGKGQGILKKVTEDILNQLKNQGVIEDYFSSRRLGGGAIVVVFPE